MEERLTALNISFSLSKHTLAHAPEVAIWVDEDGSLKAEADEAMELTQDKLAWKGSYTFDKPRKQKGLGILVKVFATRGADWTLVVKDASGKELTNVTKPVTDESMGMWCVL